MDATFLADVRAGGVRERGPAVGLFNEDRPRQHHYLFAHRELRAIAGHFADRLPGLVKSGRMDAALAMARDQVGSHLPPADRLPHAGPAASLHDPEGRSVVLVTMPRLEHGAETYFAAIVLAGDHLSDYLVLEHGWTTRDEPRTVLCKWDDQGHVNLGDGSPAEANAFLPAVQTQLRPSGA
jgi:hypothetical protein